MIKVSVFYTNNEGSKFDMNYYCNSHIPMVRQKLGAACKGAAVEQGITGADSGFAAWLHRNGPHLFRLGGGISDRIRPSRRGDHGRYSQLHRHPADIADQRGKDLGSPPSSHLAVRQRVLQ